MDAKAKMEIKAKNKRIFNLQPIPERTEEVAKYILDASFKVHTVLGPGLLESVYETCLAHELNIRGLEVGSQVSLPVVYEGIKIDTGVRLDIMVEKCVIVEVKAVDVMISVYKAQLLTYLKLSGIRLGLLINFNTIHLRDGISRLVN
jgi:GxxExxY protein